jgi:hypothetical protein
MDSTHDTNQWGWKLTTILCKTKYGNYLPAANVFFSEEENNIVSKALQSVRRMCVVQGFTWQPRYFIIDSSQIETSAIQ